MADTPNILIKTFDNFSDNFLAPITNTWFITYRMLCCRYIRCNFFCSVVVFLPDRLCGAARDGHEWSCQSEWFSPSHDLTLVYTWRLHFSLNWTFRQCNWTLTVPGHVFAVADRRPVLTVSLTGGVEEAVAVCTDRQRCVHATEGWMCLVLLQKTVNIVPTSRLVVVFSHILTARWASTTLTSRPHLRLFFCLCRWHKHKGTFHYFVCHTRNMIRLLSRMELCLIVQPTTF